MPKAILFISIRSNFCEQRRNGGYPKGVINYEKRISSL